MKQAPPSFEMGPSEESRVSSEIHDISNEWHTARVAGDKGRMAECDALAKPLRDRLRVLRAQRIFESVCPVEWVRDAADDDVLAKVGHPTLKKFATDVDAATRSALIMGPSEVGKTTAIALALKRRLLNGKPLNVRWSYARALATAAKWHPLGEGEPPELERAREAELLVLDDLGLERDTAEIVDVVHARYEARRITWTTTGLNEKQLIERYGEALVRRLWQGREPAGWKLTCFGKESTH